ncbi:MAG: hypothetical protein ACO2OV_00625 [Thermoproteota archaeon]|jgi:uncharacterized membrane protein
MKQIIPIVSLALIIIGVLLLFSYFASKGEASGSFVIVLFFVPISGGFGKYGDILLILSLILTILILLFSFITLIRRRF